MKRLVLGAAIVAALSATTAQAVPVGGNGLPQWNASNTNVIWLSGASAARTFIENLVTSPTVPTENKICKTGTAWKFQDNVTGKDQEAYLCDADKPQANGKPYILVMKRSAGGSAFGVSPIVAEANALAEGADPATAAAAAEIAFLKIDSAANCLPPNVNTPPVAPTASALGKITCVYNENPNNGDVVVERHAPDFGISDVDPAQFSGNNAPAGYLDVTADDVDKLVVKSASTLVFGVPVTKSLYFALQAAQMATGAIPASANCNLAANKESEACMPSLTSAQVASIHAGFWADWNQLKVVGSTGLYDWVAANASAYLPDADATALHTCRRENGSGTQAQSNIKFLNDPCTAAASATPPASDAVALGFSEGDGYPMIHENNTSGSVGNCLDELESGANDANGFDNQWGKRWAVGIQSMENKTSASSLFRFVKLDGVAPTLANVASGKYRDWVENTFQYAKLHKFSLIASEDAVLKNLTNTLITSAGAPQVMAALNNGYTHTFSANGAYLAVPTNHTPEANGAFLASRPVNPYSHATSSVSANACRVPTIYNTGDAKL